MTCRLEDIQVRQALVYASGTADRAGTAIDMAGYDWCLFVVNFGTIAASGVNSIKVSQCDTSGGTYADLAGTSISVAADDDSQLFAVGIVKPLEQFLKINIDKDATNACAESAIAILGRGRSPQSLANITDELTMEVHVSPAEGTA